MAVKNRITVAKGATATFEVSYYDFLNGSLTNASPDPTYTIYDSLNNVVATGTGASVSTGKYTASYAVSSSATASLLWRIEWVAYINGVIVPNNWEYFEVLSGDGGGALSDISMTNDWLEQVKKLQAFPDVDNILLTDTQIKNLCVRQALQEYFIKFPKKAWLKFSVVDESIQDFPDIYTFGVLDCRILGKGYSGTSGGSFWDLAIWNQLGYHSNFNSMYGSQIKGYNPSGLRQTRFSDQQANNSLINNGTFKYRVDPLLKKVYVYSSMSADCNITWAKYSNDFSDVLFQHQWDVIKLSQAFLLYHLADTAGLVDDSVLEAKIDVEALRERANGLITEVKEKWMEYIDPIAIIH